VSREKLPDAAVTWAYHFVVKELNGLKEQQINSIRKDLNGKLKKVHIYAGKTPLPYTRVV